MYPADLKYTKDHEWIRTTADTAEVGITDYAQQQLGDVVFVELPQVGRVVSQGEVARPTSQGAATTCASSSRPARARGPPGAVRRTRRHRAAAGRSR